MRTFVRYAFCLGFFAAAFLTGTVPAQEKAGARVRVDYTLPNGDVEPLPGATVKILDKGDKPLREDVTDATGHVSLAGLAAGEYTALVEMTGFRTTRKKVTLAGGETDTVFPVILPLEEITAAITVNAETAKDDVKRPELPETLKQQVLKSAPLANEKFQDALPLIPGVVRGPDGLLSLNGARPSQSGLLVQSVNVTDPVTGQYAMELPLEAIERVQVYSNPYAAEFGKFTGAVTTIETHQGSNKPKFLFTNFFPRLRVRDGTVRGFESFTPRLALSGPIVKDRLWISQHFEYRFILTEVPSLPELHNETQLETFDSFTRLDWAPTATHRLSSIFSVYPQNLKWVNLDTFHPQEVTPNFRQRGFFLALSDNWIVGGSSLLETHFSVKQYDAHIYPNVEAPMAITPEGWEGGYYNNQDRYSRRYELSQTYTFTQKRWKGLHDLKAGYVVSRLKYDGNDLRRPVQILRENGTRSQLLEYLGSTGLEQKAWELTTFLQDKWQIGAPVTLSLGVRLDWDSIAHRVNVAPRFGVSFLPVPSSTKTVIRAGCGIFYDKIPLSTAVFPQYQQTRVTDFGADGHTVVGGPLTFANVIQGGRVKNPYALQWNVEVDREILPGLMARVGYQWRRTHDDLVLDPVIDPVPQLVLANAGDQNYREWLFSVKYQLGERFDASVSYVHSSAKGNLNSYELFLGNYRYPVVRPDEYGPLPHDTPDRLLISGSISLPWGIIAYPVLDLHKGFPYSNVNEDQDFVGPRNEAGRFPRFLSLDVQIVKKVKIKFLKQKWNCRIGVKVFNITNHWNPRDVQNNLDSPAYGTFYNSIGRIFRGKFEIDF